MALSDKVVNGGNILLGYYDENASPQVLKPIAYATSHSIELSMDTRETSNKQTGKWRAIKPGRLNFTISAEGMNTYDGLGAVELKKLLEKRCRLEFYSYPKPGTEGDFEKDLACGGTPTPAQGSDLFEIQYGHCYIASVSEDHPDEANSTFSLQLEGSQDLKFDTWGNHKDKLNPVVDPTSVTITPNIFGDAALNPTDMGYRGKQVSFPANVTELNAALADENVGYILPVFRDMIDLANGDLRITRPLFFSGALSDGLIFKDGTINIRSSDVVIDQMSFMGSKLTSDGLSIGKVPGPVDCNRVIFQHCTTFWADDEGFSTVDGYRNIWYHMCVMANPAMANTTNSGGFGGILYNTLLNPDNALANYQYCIFINGRDRMPLLNRQRTRMYFNLVYNFQQGTRLAYGDGAGSAPNGVDYEFDADWNYWIKGPTWDSGTSSWVPWYIHPSNDQSPGPRYHLGRTWLAKQGEDTGTPPLYDLRTNWNQPDVLLVGTAGQEDMLKTTPGKPSDYPGDLFATGGDLTTYLIQHCGHMSKTVLEGTDAAFARHNEAMTDLFSRTATTLTLDSDRPFNYPTVSTSTTGAPISPDWHAINPASGYPEIEHLAFNASLGKANLPLLG